MIFILSCEVNTEAAKAANLIQWPDKISTIELASDVERSNYPECFGERQVLF